MPDIFGTIYEGIVAHCIERSGKFSHVPLPSDIVLDCREFCPNSKQCAAKSPAPKLYIHPDLGVNQRRRLSQIVYITHWRNADNFQYKLWRTVAEIFEHKIHLTGIISINWIAEPLTHKEGLLDALRMISDYSFDYGIGSGALTKTAIGSYVEKWASALRPITHEKVIAECAQSEHDNPRFADEIENLRKAVNAALAAKQKHAGPSRLWSVARDNCMKARQNRPPKLTVQSSYRTAAQLVTVLATASNANSKNLIKALAKGSDLAHCGISTSTLERLSAVVVRKRGDKNIYLVEKQPSVKGVVFRLPDFLASAVNSCDSDTLSQLIDVYRDYLESHSTWEPYLKLFTIDQSALSRIREEWPDPSKASVSQAIRSSLSGNIPRVVMEMLLAAGGQTLNSFQKLVDPKVEDRFGIPLKRIAPHGDTGFHVFRMLLSDRAGELRPPEGIPNHVLVKELSNISAETYLEHVYDDAKSRLVDFDATFDSAVAHRMRTFLSKAPNPLISFVGKRISQGNWREGGLQPTLITDVFGGKTGKCDYDFVGTDGNSGIKIVTAQDGHETDKSKELCGRIRCQHIKGKRSQDSLTCTIRHFNAFLVLDGNWTQSHVDALHYAGYAGIYSIEKFPGHFDPVSCLKI